MSILNPFDNPRAWSSTVIGGVTSPGLAIVGEFKRANEWDVKKGKGTVGGTLTFVQKPPAKGTITYWIWTREQFDEFDVYLDLLNYDPTKKDVQAVDIFHPSLAKIKLKSLVTESIGNIIHAGKGKYTCAVEFLEYFPSPPKNMVKTPSTSKPTTPGTTPGTVSDPIEDRQQAEIKKLLGEAMQP